MSRYSKSGSTWRLEATSWILEIQAWSIYLLLIIWFFVFEICSPYIAQSGLEPLLISRLSLLWCYYSLRNTKTVGICYHAKQWTADIPKRIKAMKGFWGELKVRDSGLVFLPAGRHSGSHTFSYYLLPTLSQRASQLSEEPFPELFWISWASWHPPVIQNTITSVCQILMSNRPQKKIMENEFYEVRTDSGRDGGCTTNCPVRSLWVTTVVAYPGYLGKLLAVFLFLFFLKSIPLIFQKQVMKFRLREIK